MRNLFLCVLISLFIAACSDETRENKPEVGEMFFVSNQWQFYFIDREGKSLVHLSPGNDLPTTYPDTITKPAIVPRGFNEQEYLYNNNYNRIHFDWDKELYVWNTLLPGREWMPNYTFYIGFSSTDVDTVRVRFKLNTGEGYGTSHVAEATDLYYNNVQVIKNGAYVDGDGIYIQKYDEQTFVIFDNVYNSR